MEYVCCASHKHVYDVKLNVSLLWNSYIKKQEKQWRMEWHSWNAVQMYVSWARLDKVLE